VALVNSFYEARGLRVAHIEARGTGEFTCLTSLWRDSCVCQKARSSSRLAGRSLER